MTSLTAEELLDLPAGLGQRAEGFRFEVIDSDFDPLFNLAPPVAPQIVANTHATIKRTLALEILPEQEELVDIERHLVRAYYRLPTGDPWPLGVFMFAAPSWNRWSWGRTLADTLTDQTILLDQPASSTFSLEAGQPLTAAMRQTAHESGIPDSRLSIETSTVTVASPVSWPVGTSRLQRAEDLCRLAGFYSPHFDNGGTLVFRSVPALAEGSTDHVYELDATSRVRAGSVTETNDRLKAPNVWLVVSTSPGAAQIVGEYRLPDEHPRSAANVGERVAKIDMQGIESTTAAEAAARAAAAQHPATLEWAEFDAAIDPRHDLFDTVTFDGRLWREQGWTLTCRAGGPHRHSLRRSYADA